MACATRSRTDPLCPFRPDLGVQATRAHIESWNAPERTPRVLANAATASSEARVVAPSQLRYSREAPLRGSRDSLTLDFIPPALLKLLQRLEVNRAVAYLLLSRGWQFVSGVFTVILLTRCLNGSQRGVYQLFGSLVAMQMFVELGLPGIVVLMTSHEWSRLRLNAVGRVEGDLVALGRLSSLHRFVSRWFAACAIVFLCGVSLDGYFEIGAEKPQVDWLSPWLALVAVNAAALFYVPKLSILEGCQQVGTINFYRLLQAVTGTLVVWASLLAGGGLWALVASSLVRWAWEFYLVQVRYRETFASLREHHEPVPTAWFREIRPLFWRMAIQTIGSYFSSYYFTRVVFNFQGVVEAGRFGMTWTILMTLFAASQSWVLTRSPEFGAMAARGEHAQLRRRLIKTGLISLTVFLLGAGAFSAVVYALRQVGVKQAESFLTLPETGLLIAGLALVLVAGLFQTSVRLYKRDPFLIPNSIASLAIAVLAWEAGRRFGVMGMASAYVLVVGCWSLPVSGYLAWRHWKGVEG